MQFYASKTLLALLRKLPKTCNSLPKVKFGLK